MIKQVKCTPKNHLIPEFILPIGQLCISTTADAKNATVTNFVIVVCPDRSVFLFWNPNEDDTEPEDDSEDEEAIAESMTLRTTSGYLPSFPDLCTVVRLADSIDTLCLAHHLTPLHLPPASFTKVPEGGTLMFGGPDRQAWSRLEKIPGFTEAPTISAGISSGGLAINGKDIIIQSDERQFQSKGKD